MERNIVFCFSGTGNSLKAAKDVATVLGDTEIIMMRDEYKLDGKYERIGFVFPCYAGGVPKFVLQYIMTLKLNAEMADYFFGIVTCGGSDRDSLPMLRDALLESGITLNYGKALPTVGNYIAMYPMKADVQEELKSADEETENIAREIREKSTIIIGKRKFSTTMFYKAGNVYFRSNAKRLAVSDSCNSCGICEKLCPTKTIAMENGKPTFNWQKCAQCMACIQWCPKEAINAGTETVGRIRYHNPDINVTELLK